MVQAFLRPEADVYLDADAASNQQVFYCVESENSGAQWYYRQYSLASPSTSKQETLSASLSLDSENVIANGVTSFDWMVLVNNAGTEVMCLDAASSNWDNAWHMDLSSANDLTSRNLGAQIDKSSDLSGVSNLANAVVVNSGTQVFTLDTSSDTLRLYNLGTANQLDSTWTLDSSYDFSGTSTTTTCACISSDGLHLFIIVGSFTNIYEVTLSSAWDLSTAGTPTAFGSDPGGATVPSCMWLNAAGTKLWVEEQNVSTVYEYDMSTGHDISTLSYSSVSASLQNSYMASTSDIPSVAFNGTGSHMYVMYRDTSGSDYQDLIMLTRWTCSTAYDPTTATEQESIFVASENLPQMTEDGNWWYHGNSNGYLIQQAIGTPYDWTTIDWDVANCIRFNMTSIEFQYSFCFAPGGRYFYVVHSDNSLESWELTTPFNLSTATSIGTSSPVTELSGIDYISVTGDGTNLYGYEAASDVLYRFTMSTAHDASTVSYASDSVTIDTAYSQSFPDYVRVSPAGDYIFWSNTNNGYYYDSMSTRNSLSTLSGTATGFETDANAQTFWVLSPAFPAWTAIDESTASDTDYIFLTEPSADSYVCKLSAPDIGVDTGTNPDVRYRYAKNGAGTTAVTVRLREGGPAGTARATWTHSNISTTPVTQTQTLSTAQTTSITDWSDLYLEFEFTVT